MADMVNRIVFQSSGGDKVAQDIGKIKRSFDEASRSKDAFSTGGVSGGGNSDAFSRAVAPPAGISGSTPGSRGQSYYTPGGSNQQENNHFQRFGGRGAVSGVRGAMGALQAGSGDVVNGIGGGLAMAGGLGVAGIVAAAVGAVAMGTNNLAKNDEERRKSLWTGLGQSLSGGSYANFRDSVKSWETKGYANSINPMMTAIAGAGGSYDADMLGTALSLQYRTGASAQSMGAFMGSMQKAGGTMSASRQNNIAQQGINAFGTGSLSEFYGTITSALESGMARGLVKGSAAFSGMYGNIVQGVADLGNYGGMTVGGATQTFTGMMGSVTGMESGVRNGMDAWRFYSARKSGESYGDTIRRASGMDRLPTEYANLKARAGGNRDLLEQMLVQAYEGVTYNNVGGVINAQEQRAWLTANPQGMNGTLPVADDDTLKRFAAGAITRNALEGVDTAAGGVKNAIVDLVLGQRGLNTEQKESLQTWKHFNRSGGYATVAGSMNNNTSQFLSYMPPEMQAYASSLFSSDIGGSWARQGGSELMDNMLPLFASYGAWKSGKVKFSDQDAAMFEQNKGAFELGISAIGGAGSAFSSDANIRYLEQALNEANLSGIDGSTTLLSILDVLKALKDRGIIVTDEEQTPSDAGL